jgi:hypothetical protein
MFITGLQAGVLSGSSEFCVGGDVLCSPSPPHHQRSAERVGSVLRTKLEGLRRYAHRGERGRAVAWVQALLGEDRLAGHAVRTPFGPGADTTRSRKSVTRACVLSHGGFYTERLLTGCLYRPDRGSGYDQMSCTLSTSTLQAIDGATASKYQEGWLISRRRRVRNVCSAVCWQSSRARV